MTDKQVKQAVSGLIALVLAITWLSAPALFSVLLFALVVFTLVFPLYLLIRGQWGISRSHRNNRRKN